MIRRNVKNPCESMISTVPFPRVEGYRGLAQRAVVEADPIRRRNNRHKDLTEGVDL